MEIRVLRYFLAVVREGGITQAAHSLHLSQPTVSRQIKELEEELGAQLLVRRRRGTVELTREGLMLRNRAEEILAMVDRTEDDLRSLTGVVEGDVYIGGGETYAFSELAQLAQGLRAQHPGLRFQLFSGNAEDVVERLDNGLLDFGLVVHPRQVPRLRYLRLPFQDRWVLVLPQGDALAGKERIALADVADKPLVLSRQAIRRTQSSKELLDWLGGDLEQLNVAATYNLAYNASLLVEQGLGYMIAFDYQLSQESLVSRPLDPDLTADVYVAWRRDKVFSPAAGLFLEALLRSHERQQR